MRGVGPVPKPFTLDSEYAQPETSPRATFVRLKTQPLI